MPKKELRAFAEMINKTVLIAETSEGVQSKQQQGELLEQKEEKNQLVHGAFIGSEPIPSGNAAS